jgi:hypothetical protein
MSVPLDAIRAIHNGFRKDMAAMDAAANACAAGGGDCGLVTKRYLFFNEVLVWHALGEEDAVFPALEEVAPLVSEAYERDHRGLDAAFESLHKAVNASDRLATARATAAMNFHLRIHLDKEDAHLYRIFNEKIPLHNQGVIIGQMSQRIPPERFPELAGWLFPLVQDDDRENMTRIWMQVLPPLVFAKLAKVIKAAVRDNWAELARRIPELNKLP